MADLVSGFETSDSFVIGIEGAWGSGKTSFINMVLERLDEQVLSFTFNPWHFTDSASLLDDFFNHFAETVQAHSKGKLGRKIQPGRPMSCSAGQTYRSTNQCAGASSETSEERGRKDYERARKREDSAANIRGLWRG